MNPTDLTELCIGKTYYIESVDSNEKLRHTGIFLQYKIYDYNTYIIKLPEFINIKNIKGDSSTGLYEAKTGALRNTSWKFYEKKKEIIQHNMEKRAVDLFLQQIIGDIWFTA